MRCPGCRAEVEAEQDFCMECGEPIAQAKPPPASPGEYGFSRKPVARVRRSGPPTPQPPPPPTPRPAAAPPPAAASPPVRRIRREEEPEPVRCRGCGTRSTAARCPECGTRLREE